MNSDSILELNEDEAKTLWSHLNQFDHLDSTLLGICRRLESALWDRLSIDDMARIKKTGGLS